MVKSVAGKYKDLVAMCPVAGGLTAAKLNDCYKNVMETGSFSQTSCVVVHYLPAMALLTLSLNSQYICYSTQSMI